MTIHLFHPSDLGETTRRALEKRLNPLEMSKNCFVGDTEPIPDAMLVHSLDGGYRASRSPETIRLCHCWTGWLLDDYLYEWEFWFSQRCDDVWECFSSQLSALVFANEQRECFLLVSIARMGIGGAMYSPAVKDFTKRCFTHCNVNEAYGITECGSITFRNNIEKTVEYRLESVPELGYTVDDQPYPRGELLAKTTQMFSGYINNPHQTADVLTHDGFFRTGDTVELRPSSTNADGKEPCLHVIDRKKNFSKLAQGQFIAPEYLQSLFIESAFIDQIFIHADLTSDTLTAVVVPNRDNTQLFLKQQQHLTSLDENDPPAMLFDAILADLRSIGEKETLRPHEIPSRLIIDFQPFTPENGLLTSSMKLCLYKLAAHYAHQLKFSPSTSVQQRLKQIIESVRGKAVGEQQTSLISSGTDSLSTVRLSKLIEKDLGISIPLHILFDPNITLQHLTDLNSNLSPPPLSHNWPMNIDGIHQRPECNQARNQLVIHQLFSSRAQLDLWVLFSWLNCCECIRLIVEWSAWFDVIWSSSSSSANDDLVSHLERQWWTSSHCSSWWFVQAFFRTWPTNIPILSWWSGCNLSLCGQCQFRSLCSSTGEGQRLWHQRSASSCRFSSIIIDSCAFHVHTQCSLIFVVGK